MNLFVQRIKFLLVLLAQNFGNMCLKIYKLDPVNFLLNPGLAWQAAIKKTKVQLELLILTNNY